MKEERTSKVSAASPSPVKHDIIDHDVLDDSEASPSVESFSENSRKGQGFTGKRDSASSSPVKRDDQVDKESKKKAKHDHRTESKEQDDPMVVEDTKKKVQEEVIRSIDLLQNDMEKHSSSSKSELASYQHEHGSPNSDTNKISDQHAHGSPSSDINVLEEPEDEDQEESPPLNLDNQKQEGKIHIEDRFQTKEQIAILVRNRAKKAKDFYSAASLKRFLHILDPQTDAHTNDRISVRNGMLDDAFVTGQYKGLKPLYYALHNEKFTQVSAAAFVRAMDGHLFRFFRRHDHRERVADRLFEHGKVILARSRGELQNEDEVKQDTESEYESDGADEDEDPTKYEDEAGVSDEYFESDSEDEEPEADNEHVGVDGSNEEEPESDDDGSSTEEDDDN